jgi:hypothetical protein
MSLIFYCDKKVEWGREEYTVCCTRNGRSGLAWFKTGIWKLRGMRKGDALYVERKMLYIYYKNVRKRRSGENIF